MEIGHGWKKEYYIIFASIERGIERYKLGISDSHGSVIMYTLYPRSFSSNRGLEWAGLWARVYYRNIGGRWQKQCRQPSEDHWSEHSPRWRHPHPVETGQTSRKTARASRMLATIQGWTISLADGVPKWELVLRFVPLSSIERWKKKKRKKMILRIPLHILLLALSKCLLPLGGRRPER